MIVRNYRNLNLVRANIETECRQFIQTKTYTVQSIGPMPGQRPGLRVRFAKTGESFATVDIFYNSDGSSTVQYRTGANQSLGKELADHLFETINPAEFEHVNMVVEGFVEDTLIPILELSAEETHIEYREHFRNAHSIVWKITSTTYQDELAVTLHTTTGKLQIQGRPLSCYRVFTFNLAELLNLQGLEKVLIRQDDGKASIVQQEVARANLESIMGDAYAHLHTTTEKLLISGLCVKLAAPELPDYCMLLYPELRAIEGVLKSKMSLFGMSVQQLSGFGPFFDRVGSSFTLKSQFSTSLSSNQVNIVNDAYTFWNKERHAVFHMETVVDTSRMISDMARLMTKATKAWQIIKDLYLV
ncbi:type II toxin-antitoxin system RnlA family toxin [Morganella morganii]|uniref:type II toxin-antitoxin system RnlA family toxin n=1 Tax=Morganella morganii TaxID=582 RepID=UPI0003DD15A6|nr:type II toxin-antitoxin system RnlA family toxin [Morganella morganii]EJG2203089.1 type II toxin-antitoxin system RnlA family toxin [Morganella morganii]ELN8408405.1 type II toxin-antitoxin system RnlA family toxin [Morganella morganii]MBX9344569.1 type II toxin-antitoxin system RnlA family toxin [Morganella morganii]MBX9369804.1 type II toxin-antitoxin system RnlA family toxin [Morganella morganii]MDS0909105.1 type II toxin-antitoxin system RnlA family toxin [Morganella morganii]